MSAFEENSENPAQLLEDGEKENTSFLAKIRSELAIYPRFSLLLLALLGLVISGAIVAVVTYFLFPAVLTGLALAITMGAAIVASVAIGLVLNKVLDREIMERVAEIEQERDSDSYYNTENRRDSILNEILSQCSSISSTGTDSDNESSRTAFISKHSDEGNFIVLGKQSFLAEVSRRWQYSDVFGRDRRAREKFLSVKPIEEPPSQAALAVFHKAGGKR